MDAGGILRDEPPGNVNTYLNSDKYGRSIKHDVTKLGSPYT